MSKKYIGKCYIHSSKAKTRFKRDQHIFDLYFNSMVPFVHFTYILNILCKGILTIYLSIYIYRLSLIHI